jgi:peptide/nickel transport system permease protein
VRELVEFRAYIVRRLLLMLLVLFGVVSITFVVSHVIPADPIGSILGPQAPDEVIEKMRHEWGLDRPLHEQFINYVWNLLHGHFGMSIRTNRPIALDLMERFPDTIELSTASMVIAVCIGIPLGIVSACRKDKIPDHFSRVFSLFGISLPVFWSGLVLLMLFYYRLHWLPGPGPYDTYLRPPAAVTGFISLDSLIAGDMGLFINHLQHLILPAFVLGLNAMASIARMTRSSMLEVLRQDYIKAAKSKGLKERTVVFKHALRNAMIPTTTIIGLSYGSLLEGAVLTETIFAWPGLGTYVTGAILYLDFQAVMSTTLLIALTYSLCNLIVDILYAFLDPRIKYG